MPSRRSFQCLSQEDTNVVQLQRPVWEKKLGHAFRLQLRRLFLSLLLLKEASLCSRRPALIVAPFALPVWRPSGDCDD